MREITIKVYAFNELRKYVKNKVIKNYRSIIEFDDEHMIDEFKTILGAIGFYNIKVRYDGFGSQGDGASFSADFEKSDDVVRKVADINDSHDLKMIVRDFMAFIPKNRKLSIGLETSRYQHEYTMELKPIDEEHYYTDAIRDGDRLLILSRQLAKWFFKRLQKEYEYQNEDEFIIEYIKSNNYEFFEDGRLFLGVRDE